MFICDGFSFPFVHLFFYGYNFYEHNAHVLLKFVNMFVIGS